ncbi:MSMEG_0567/Sll0786 family nitrogen starvation N-acetyltransferase [Methylotenera sp.]|uniref:MSMEG_0567/Sll0786 family nitrogen starvation N-acetyltransferase n=1 Tax=Methylotenera sp. TaxID=2051956 RepID=UPI0027369525|nr:MSMEG_0567/Sll0786 family nitrogen starvation N-acetyltransferase [Methylotenera sp.]MDP3777656.1 GNAT family N-acetyltransferase [Methylotenera sp.]
MLETVALNDTSVDCSAYSEIPKYQPVEYLVKWATLPWEVEQAMQIRRDVFCEEQGIFDGNDRDEIDDKAQIIVAISCEAGHPDTVVGTVRIHQEETGVWFGSRLAVHQHYRSQGKLGASLIKLAVSSANWLGCRTFLAHVQSQNVLFFRRLHWDILQEETLLNRSHHLMQARLEKYPPFQTPIDGFVIQTRS